MYNRYIPQDTTYVPLDQPEEKEQKAGKKEDNSPPFSFKGLLSGGIPDKLKSILKGEGTESATSILDTIKAFHVGKLDSGDILIILIILFLLIEGEDQWELVITLGLLLIFGLMEKETPPTPHQDE